MMAAGVQRQVLRLRLALARVAWPVPVIAALLTASAASWLFAVPRLQARIDEQQRLLGQARAQLAAPRAPLQETPGLAERRLRAFYDALGDTRHAGEQVRTLFALAARNGLALSQADYKLLPAQDAHFRRYRIELPVSGPYPAIRRFCEQVLEAIPFASLDGISFQRGAIGTSQIDAKLRLSLYLNDAVPATFDEEDPS